MRQVIGFGLTILALTVAHGVLVILGVNLHLMDLVIVVAMVYMATAVWARGEAAGEETGWPGQIHPMYQAVAVMFWCVALGFFVYWAWGVARLIISTLS